MTVIDIDEELETIGKAVFASISYECYPVNEIDNVIKSIDDIITDNSVLKNCENHLKSSGSDYVLFFLSNIIYNLKAKGELVLTPDVLKWLGSVWKNFLTRNKTYQEFLPLYGRYSMLFNKYYPGDGTFVNQIENVHLVKEDFIDNMSPEFTAIKELEAFYTKANDILTTMKPTYFFLLDYYYEKKMATGEDLQDAVVLESLGLTGFGYSKYTFRNIALVTCQCLGILEATYLILKKRKMNKQLTNFDGKLKLLSVSEIYDMYLKKFNQMKKELLNLK